MVKRIFIAKVRGEYITAIGDERVLKAYSATFRLPDASAPLGMIKGKLLMPFLKKLDPAAIAPYSWHLQELAPEHGEFDPDELPVLFQTIPQLKEYCKRHKLAVPVEEYGDLEIARQHVLIAKESPSTFAKVFEKYSATMSADRELTELNQNFEGIGSASGEVEVDAQTGAINRKPAAAKPAPAKNRKPAPAVDEDDEGVLS